MSRLKFDDKNHLYLLDNKPITGTTTILKVLAKPVLISWAVGMAVDYIKENAPAETLKGLEHRVVSSIILNEARKAHTRQRDKAGNIGKLVHSAISEFLKKGIEPKLDKQGMKMFENFRKWMTDNKVKFLASEKQVYSEKYWFAGTYDFLCETDNQIFLGDIKTSSDIYPENFAQCAAYRICEEEMNPGQRIDGQIIVNITKKGKLKVEKDFDYIGFKNMFLSCLMIYRQLENYKKKGGDKNETE